MTRRVAQRKLTLIWAGFTVFLLIIFFVQTVVGDKYPGQNDEVWDWLMPLVFPTFTLMVGALVAVAQSPTNRQPTVDKFYYRLTLGAFVVYFLTIFSVILSAPFDFMMNGTPALDHLKKATKLLSALQALVTLVLGIFFWREDKGAN